MANPYDELIFQLNGGWTGVLTEGALWLLKWAVIASMFALAFRLIA